MRSIRPIAMPIGESRRARRMRVAVFMVGVVIS